MESWDFWRLHQEMSVNQAAHLIIGMLPGEIEAMAQSGSELYPRDLAKYKTGLVAAQSAITNALRSGKIKGTIVQTAIDSWPTDNPVIDIDESLIEVESLREWLARRGFKSGFFFPKKIDTPDYLDPDNPRYSNKLAAAVNAWLCVTEPGAKSPKQALEKWLRENAADFSLTDDDGNPINAAIEQCSTVANWNTKGGAPKTPD